MKLESKIDSSFLMVVYTLQVCSNPYMQNVQQGKCYKTIYSIYAKYSRPIEGQWGDCTEKIPMLVQSK